MKINPSKLIKFAKACLGVVSKVIPEHSSKYSRKDYTQHQLMTLVCLMRKYKPKYRDFIELLEVMNRLAEFLGLEKIPHFTTLNKFFLRMKNAVFSILLQLSAGKSSGETSVDSTGFDRRHASRHYTKRSRMHIKSIKSTHHIDTETQKILNMHNTTTRKHDTQIMLPLVKKTRTKHKIKSARGDRGYDDKEIRDTLRDLGIRPLIKHREFKSIDKAHNARMSKKDYNQRLKNETVNSALKRKYGDHVSSKKWNNQFKEMKLMGFVYNLDVDLRTFLIGFLQG
jgi:IS5 family transposase